MDIFFSIHQNRPLRKYGRYFLTDFLLQRTAFAYTIEVNILPGGKNYV